MSYTPSAQQRARAMMWTQWCWGSCLRCWRSSVDISYLYSAGMNSLDKVCFHGGIRQQMTKIRGHTCDPSTGEAEPGWMGTQGQLGLYVETLSQTRTKKGNFFPFLSHPLLSLPLFHVTNVPWTHGTFKSLCPSPTTPYIQKSGLCLYIVLQHNVRESWFQSYESLWHRDTVHPVMGTSSSLGQNWKKWKNSHGHSLCHHWE